MLFAFTLVLDLAMDSAPTYRPKSQLFGSPASSCAQPIVFLFALHRHHLGLVTLIFGLTTLTLFYSRHQMQQHQQHHLKYQKQLEKELSRTKRDKRRNKSATSFSAISWLTMCWIFELNSLFQRHLLEMRTQDHESKIDTR